MSHLNPLEKEVLIKRYRSNAKIRIQDFCITNNVSVSAFKKWLKQYEEDGIEGLARADKTTLEVLPEGIDRTEEAYKRAVTTKGKLASFLFLRNSLINNESSGPGPAIDEERKKEQNDLLIDPNQVDIHTNEENHDNEQHKHEHDHDEHEHEHGQAHNHSKIDPSSFTPYILLIALGFHGFFEGLALGLQENLQGTLFLFVAIIAHKWAESLSLGISFVKAKATKKSIILMCSLFSIIGPLGVVVGILLSIEGGEVIEGILLGLSTGTFLYVACSEVIVEEFAVSKYKIPKFILYIIGGVFTAFLAVLEHLNGGHEH